MSDSSLANISSILSSLSMVPMGKNRGQEGSGDSAANKDQNKKHLGSNEPFSEIPLTFEPDKDLADQKVTSLQSFADFIVIHNLSTHMQVVPRYHGPKLIKLASMLSKSSN